MNETHKQTDLMCRICDKILVRAPYVIRLEDQASIMADHIELCYRDVSGISNINDIGVDEFKQVEYLCGPYPTYEDHWEKVCAYDNQ